MELEHRLGLRGEEEVLRRDPRRKLLLDGEVALVLFRYFTVETVAGVLQVALAHLHAFGENDLLRRHHLQHVRIRRDGPVPLQAPEALMWSAPVVLHEFLDSE